MGKAPAALGAGEARTWPCGCRAPLAQPWQNSHTHNNGTCMFFGRTDKQTSWCSKKCLRSPTRTLKTSEHQERARQSITGHGASVVGGGRGRTGLSPSEVIPGL
jgi:hypothetical protein